LNPLRPACRISLPKEMSGTASRFLVSAAALGLMCLVANVQAAEPAADTAGQRALFDSYQMCATLHLPEDFRQIRDPESSATAATGLCRVERLALAGQFALDNPGTQETARYLATQRKRVIATLGNWIIASTTGSPPHPLTPQSR
jgi:hypothetical protein